jgi:outer membrane protein, heavy metal efflux system
LKLPDRTPKLSLVRAALWLAGMVLAGSFCALGTRAQGPVRITLDEAIQLALQHNHNLLATRTTIEQSEAEEITANLRPNPVFSADDDFIPVFSPSYFGVSALLTPMPQEVDASVAYTIEMAHKRQARLAAARSQTAVTRSQVADNERTLTFQVASQFVNAQLAESTLDLAQQDLKSYQNTVDLAQIRYKSGAISEDDYLKIHVQLLQFQTDVAEAQLARVQALADLRVLLGYESVPVNYDVAGTFEYAAVKLSLEDLQSKALQNRPDLRAAVQGVTGAGDQYRLARANGKPDITPSLGYSESGGESVLDIAFSLPLPVFNRNQGEIARTRVAITQAQELQKAAGDQVMNDVHDAYYGVETNDQIVQLYLGGYLAEAQADRDIAEYSYQRGAASLLDFLDAERSYRATQLAYRQTLAAYLLALEQLRESVGVRNLP